MLKHTLMGTALAISVVSALAAGPAVPGTPAPPPPPDRVGALEAELAALHQRMAGAIRARIDEVHQEIQVLHEQGRHEEADHLEMMAREHLQQLHQSLGMELGGAPQPEPEITAEAEGLFRECVGLHDAGHVEKARDLLASALEAHIEDPRTPAIMERFIAHMHESGRPDMARQAEQLFQQAMMRHAEALHSHEQALQEHQRQLEMEQVHRHITDLRDNGRLEEAEAIQREFEQQMRAREEASRREHLEAGAADMERRLQHLHAAAENLHVAGLHGQAEDLLRQAEQIQRQFHQEQAGHAMPPIEDALPMIMGQIEGLRAEVAELRQIVHRLQRRINAMGAQSAVPAPPARPGPAGRSAPSGGTGIGGRHVPPRQPLPHVPPAVPDPPRAPTPAAPPAHEHEHE